MKSVVLTHYETGHSTAFGANMKTNIVTKQETSDEANSFA